MSLQQVLRYSPIAGKIISFLDSESRNVLADAFHPTEECGEFCQGPLCHKNSIREIFPKNDHGIPCFVCIFQYLVEQLGGQIDGQYDPHRFDVSNFQEKKLKMFVLSASNLNIYVNLFFS